jgi:hypothetical protein
MTSAAIPPQVLPPLDGWTAQSRPPESGGMSEQQADGVRTPKPTLQQAGALQFLFDYFNDALFDGRLKQSLIGHQKGRAFGTFAPNRFVRMDGDGTRIHEITLNPSLFRAIPNPAHPPLQPDEQRAADLCELCRTLVHEMAHQYDEQFGKPGKAGYHSLSWGAIMKKIGLPPSSTGKRGGDETGYHMLEYVEPGGLFDQAFQRLLREPPTIWRDAWQQQLVLVPPPPKKRKRIKYVCPNGCGFTYEATPSAAEKGACRACGFATMVPAT